jgi:hypothetical protein
MKTHDRNIQGRRTIWRLIGWGAIAGLIALPAIAMQFSEGVNWTAGDFVFAAVMLGGVGLGFELAVRASGSLLYRAGAALALGAGLTLLWANAAVGIVGSETASINLWFNLSVPVALAGAAIARLRARGMAMAMVAAAGMQLTAGAIVQALGHWAWIATFVWSAAWLASAWLFARAAPDQA